MEIRKATAQDRALWLSLWREYAEEQYKLGSVIVPSSATFRQYLELFNSYTLGSLFGMCLLAEIDGAPMGTLLGGEHPAGLHFETTRGKTAILWGVYTVPEYRRQGVSNALLKEAKKIGSSELGFETVVSEILPFEMLERNALAAGTKPYSTTVWGPMKE